VRANLFEANRDWQAYPERGRLIYQDEDGLLDLPPPRLPGRHQFTNAGTAVAALRRAGLRLTRAAFETGLLTVEWPARLQSLSSGTLSAQLPKAEIWLDGGHNPAAGQVIAEAMADLEERAPKPLVLISGMLNTKEPVGFFRPFAGLARTVYTVPVPGAPASRSAEDLAAAATAAGLSARTATDVPAALGAITAEGMSLPPRVLICGSLYLAGTVLAANGTPPR
jgi:dihydrofolate synthase/folylpolyglutamate synthase